MMLGQFAGIDLGKELAPDASTPRQFRGDSADAGQKEVIRETSPKAQDFNKAYRHRPLSQQAASANRYQSKLRARVEPILWRDETPIEI